MFGLFLSERSSGCKRVQACSKSFLWLYPENRFLALRFAKTIVSMSKVDTISTSRVVLSGKQDFWKIHVFFCIWPFWTFFQLRQACVFVSQDLLVTVFGLNKCHYDENLSFVKIKNAFSHFFEFRPHLRKKAFSALFEAQAGMRFCVTGPTGHRFWVK